jgi:hypothetical protein
MKFGFWLNLNAMVILATAGTPALAGEPLTVLTERTQLITLSAEPGTVVVGNPAIADVTVNGKQIFVHGYAYGETNLMILDTTGNQIANFDITVASNSASSVVLYKAGLRYTYTCSPLCEASVQVGDEYMSKVIGDNQAKAGFATSKKSTDVAAPPPSQ